MNVKIYGVYDEKAKAFFTPHFAPNEAIAVRTFGDCVNDPQHNFSLHPEDYTLFELGTFNQVEGLITPHESKISLVNGVQLRKAAD